MELYEAVQGVIVEVKWVFYMLIGLGAASCAVAFVSDGRGHHRFSVVMSATGMFFYGMWAGTYLCRLLILARL